MSQENKIEANDPDQQRTSSHREQRLVVLLPCPFCASEAKTYHASVTCSNPRCKMHFACVPNMHTAEEWNQRMVPDEESRMIDGYMKLHPDAERPIHSLHNA